MIRAAPRPVRVYVGCAYVCTCARDVIPVTAQKIACTVDRARAPHGHAASAYRSYTFPLRAPLHATLAEESEHLSVHFAYAPTATTQSPAGASLGYENAHSLARYVTPRSTRVTTAEPRTGLISSEREHGCQVRVDTQRTGPSEHGRVFVGITPGTLREVTVFRPYPSSRSLEWSMYVCMHARELRGRQLLTRVDMHTADGTEG